MKVESSTNALICILESIKDETGTRLHTNATEMVITSK